MRDYERDEYVHPGKRYLNNGLVAGYGHGLGVRDHFAGLALMGMLAHSTKRYKPRVGAPENWHDAIAEEAYEIADAMMRVRGE
jgi:hypothetical protein